MIKKTILFSLMIVLFINCWGDKKTAIGTNFNDTSFVSKNFKTKIYFSDLASPCSYISKEILAKLYNVSVDKILTIEGNAQNKTCTLRVKLSDEEYNYLVGSIRFYEEKDKLEDGTSWVESWQLQKGISKSAEWIPNLGNAALWIDKKRELRVKFKNYTMAINVPGAAFNKKEKALNRDYKKIALALADKTPILK
ncbi:MAG: hypothetical protein ABJH82_09795 [Polaribacter sp.]|uniref:hypothetical protein n=1 Tax=Polaribacter sp. TaxID=1920175 RepID=UPI0032636A6A